MKTISSPRAMDRSTEFPIIDRNEHTVITVRRHWFVLFVELFGLVVLLFAPLVLGYVYVALATMSPVLSLPLFAIPTATYIFLGSVWTFLMWVRLFSIWTDYYLDTWIVTTKRIIDIDQEGYFKRSVGSFPIIRIQDVSFRQDGVLASLLDYGTLHVETAGSNTEEFRIENIPNPRKLRDIINKELDDALARLEHSPNATQP
jgi:membrane protein YdbS with pleckstrin-like domain